CNNAYWRSTKRKIVNKEILIEAIDEAVNGYYLYGTAIPIIFCYPGLFDMTYPNMQTCIGVETKQWEISKFMKLNYPDGEFHYAGKYITGEDVIAWLENEKNIESMKRVKEWALQYGKECQEVLENIKKWRIETSRMQRCSHIAEEEAKRQKLKKRIDMLDRRDELVSRYQ
ncbi:MAG: hypothetical protein K2I72_02955, partial [Bacilli bacterium]|nr:hypothetical protein [Bacilli bacterium]